jgi:hypothetical protein
MMRLGMRSVLVADYLDTDALALVENRIRSTRDELAALRSRTDLHPEVKQARIEYRAAMLSAHMKHAESIRNHKEG